MGSLARADRELLPAALRQNSGFHLATQWYLDWDPLWYQYLFHQSTVPNVTFIAGIACVDGDTLILHPDGSETPIAELVGKEIEVVAWDGKRFVGTKASPPFLKGKAGLYRIKLDNGLELTATLEHQVLTPDGYVALKELHVGSLVGVLSSQDQTIRVQDASRCSQTTPSSQSDYCFYPHLYDGQLLPVADNDPGSVRQPTCVHEHNHDGLRTDGLVSLSAHSHSCQTIGHPYTLGFASPLAHPLFAFLLHGVQGILEHARHLVRQLLRLSRSNSSRLLQGKGFLSRMDQDGLAFEPSPSYLEKFAFPFQAFYGCEPKSPLAFRGFFQRRSISCVFDKVRSAIQRLQKTSLSKSCNSSCDCYNYRTGVLFCKVVSLDYVKDGLFYDIQVPDYNNYVGNSIVNHNSGKTTSVAASYLIDCLSIPYFRCLNTSVTAKQAELPFEMVTSWIEGNKRIEHLIEDIALRPYPTIKFTNYSEWIFRTAGKDARFIRGQEFDRINYDECGLDFSGEAVKVLRGRLRGTRPNKLHRMGRMDAITSPTDAPWLRERFDRGWPDNPRAILEDYLSLRISTYMNTRLTRKSISLMEAEYSDEMIDVELKGLFPDYGMSLFPKVHVNACTDQSLNDAVEMALRPEAGPVKKGYRIEEHPRHGITLFELPADPKSIYVMGGDPGTDSPPKRNAPVVFVLDVTKKPFAVVYFHWVDGRGSYNPFLASYKYAIEKYRPVLKGVDTTGTQKAIDELAFENMGISIDGINFQRDKEAMLNSLSISVTNHDIKWPLVKGISTQMSSYSRENDKNMPQDIVMAMAEVAFLSRYVPEASDFSQAQTKANYRNRKARTNVRRRR